MTREKIWIFFANSIERLQILDFFICENRIVNSSFLSGAMIKQLRLMML
jgi:hypothetical protein